MFNDWQNAAHLVPALKSELEQNTPSIEATFFVIDDGSTERASAGDLSALQDSQVVLMHLPRNVGHQRAIIAGIVLALENDPECVIVMDSDGEDKPETVSRLLVQMGKSPGKIVVAKRGARFESAAFRTLYVGHKIIFRLLVGQSLDFGNFLLLPLPAARRIAQMPEALNHFPAAILKSRVAITRVNADRGKRRFGKSKMNMERLISHSFSSLSIFTEQIMVRLVIFSFFATVMSALAAAAVVAVRFSTDLATPGWATAALGLLVVFSLQFLSFAGLATLMTLNVSTLKHHLSGKDIEPHASKAMTVGWKSGPGEPDSSVHAFEDSR